MTYYVVNFIIGAMLAIALKPIFAPPKGDVAYAAYDRRLGRVFRNLVIISLIVLAYAVLRINYPWLPNVHL